MSEEKSLVRTNESANDFFIMYISNSNKAKIYYVYYINTATGKITSKSLRTKDRTEALRLFAEFKSPAALRLSDVRGLLFAYIDRNNSRNTYRSYLLTYNHFIRIAGDKPVQDINKNDIEVFKSVRINEVSPASVNIDIRNLKAVFSKLVSLDLVEYSKISCVAGMRIDIKPVLSINRRDLDKIIEHIQDTQIRGIVRMSLLTANRISETLNIKIKDIGGVLSVYQAKSNKYKYIPVTGNIRVLLGQLLSGREADGGDYLFHKPGNQAVKLRSDYVSKYFKRVVRQLGLNPLYKFHCLRHTAITELIKNNVPVPVVKEIAGHSSINTTMLYTHIHTEDMRKGLDTLNF